MFSVAAPAFICDAGRNGVTSHYSADDGAGWLYSDVDRRVITRSDLTATGDLKLVQVQHFDQLGLICLSRTLEDASTSAGWRRHRSRMSAIPQSMGQSLKPDHRFYSYLSADTYRRRRRYMFLATLTHTRLSSKPPALRSARRSASASPKPITPSVANIHILAV